MGLWYYIGYQSFFSLAHFLVISFKFFVCFIFNVSLGSAPKRKNFDIQCNTRVASGGQFTLNYHTPSHMQLHYMSIFPCIIYGLLRRLLSKNAIARRKAV